MNQYLPGPVTLMHIVAGLNLLALLVIGLFGVHILGIINERFEKEREITEESIRRARGLGDELQNTLNSFQSNIDINRSSIGDVRILARSVRHGLDQLKDRWDRETQAGNQAFTELVQLVADWRNETCGRLDNLLRKQDAEFTATCDRVQALSEEMCRFRDSQKAFRDRLIIAAAPQLLILGSDETSNEELRA